MSVEQLAVQDIFVGGVAVTLGVLALTAAAMNWDWCFRLWKVQRLQTWCGRGGARIVYALIGLALIALGCAIVMGFAPNKGNTQQGNQQRGSNLYRPGDAFAFVSVSATSAASSSPAHSW